jgi:hypothetical protein
MVIPDDNRLLAYRSFQARKSHFLNCASLDNFKDDQLCATRDAIGKHHEVQNALGSPLARFTNIGPPISGSEIPE